jgi:hypothetical protein
MQQKMKQLELLMNILTIFQGITNNSKTIDVDARYDIH